MSLKAQENVLFELLFDDDFREEYSQNAASALSLYGLTSDEVNDFLPLRLDALELEADVRKRMILSQICSQAPLSIAMLSSFENGLDIAKKIIKPFIVRAIVSERCSLFLQQLIFLKDELLFFNEQDQILFTQILKLELCFAKQLSHSNLHHLRQCKDDEDNAAKNSNIECDKALVLSPLLGVNYLPLSYWQIKKELCAVDSHLLWRELQETPILIEQRLGLFTAMSEDSSKCIISLARLLQSSPTDPKTDLHIIEMIDGFLPLLNKVNGERSLNDILQLFESAGASADMIQKVIQGFETLFQEFCVQYN